MASFSRVVITVLSVSLPVTALTHHCYGEPASGIHMLRHLDVKRNVPELDGQSHWREHQSLSILKNWNNTTDKSFSDWISLGPEGGHITSMTMHPDDPNVIYASTYASPCQIHRTTDGGESWNFMSSIDGTVSSLTCDRSTPSVLCASTLGEYVYKSTDGGLNWETYRTNTNRNYIYDLVLHPTGSNTIWGAANFDDGSTWVMAVTKSVDGCSTWSFTPLTAGRSGAGYSVAVDPANPDVVYVTGFYYKNYVPHPAFFKTTDGGLHWQDVGSDVDSLGITGYAHALVIDPMKSGNVYAGGHYWNEYSEQRYLLGSMDGGLHWVPMDSGIASPVYSLVIDSLVSATLYAGTSDKVYKSVNGGLSWSSTGAGIVGPDISCLLLDGATSSTLYAGNRVGVFKTTDAGGTWSFSSSGMATKSISALSVAHSSPNVIYVGVEDDALYRSTDDGVNWVRLHEFEGCHGVNALAVDPQNANKIYVFTGG